MTNCIAALMERLQPEHIRLGRLYDALRQITWPELPSGQVIRENGAVTYVTRPELTPEQIARVVTDPACLEEIRTGLLKAHEVDLRRLLRKKAH